ncbi:MAG: Rrf2 family transcriptional regulator [Nitrospinaceae bacterium]|jgi:Rrf2 family transcriptional regulator, iron-sulfur cluster assembly transcription factor|nr:Rrf2 family transcriptional regulator [Nitrospinaceae bacterium]MBT3823272.1 Rrf2 family transcriptional regulator [Nitrospinaceae bacterium]MBT4092622.1 Rrf2 family transcriptional regulator [Nitrospinaceae bacterium]MBT4429194.1 Rrf2 family transcriptional regulator [Nitrospinaceae bacterium]MBT5368506.1 Rrf2 family transcriptional regulator [Nitrospinaceae bacterium]
MGLFSAPVRHAMFVLVYMVHLEKGKICTVQNISKDTGISEPTAAKILQMLVKGRILDSKKGPGGGFLLAVPQEQITLARILLAIEGRESFSNCVVGLGVCGNASVCPHHAKWALIKQELNDFLNSATIHEIDFEFLSENK